MADFTETPHAEDFAHEVSELIDEYRNRGLTAGWMIEILGWSINDLEDDQ